MITGERQASRIRALYLQAIIRQDVSFFDQEVSSGDVISRMSEDTVLIQEAMGEKVGDRASALHIFHFPYTFFYTHTLINFCEDFGMSC